ncbi:flavin reductase family protein [Kocuria flava]|uniref:flavin reductase family protein n=1 Tax=Kocuria flava TaxID=446860 RepID=UPI001FF6935A|nr:flavin reductase family protein [Kocuria flava]MCJ8506225.1 flavin reductase family protein [Kocuria flava]
MAAQHHEPGPGRASEDARLSVVPDGGVPAERFAADVRDLEVPADHLAGLGSVGELFKAAFAHHPAGVAVITARGPEGPVGLTASSVSSVSVDPPILGFSLQARRGSAAVVAEAPSFLVHLLDAEDLALAQSFAVSGAPRFGADMPWEELPTGEPRLLGVGRVLRAVPLARIKAGPALVFNAAVVDVLGAESSGSPLVYHRRRFHGLSEDSALPGSP